MVPYQDLTKPGRSLLLGCVLLGHLVAAWALWQSVGARQMTSKPEPIVLNLIAPALPPSAEPKSPPLRSMPVKSSSPAPTPEAQAPLSTTPATLSISQTAAPAEAATQIAAAISTQVPAPPQATAAPPSIGPRQLAPGAMRYLVEPQMTVPLASRRLGESGVVHLRIVVDARGFLKEVSLKKSAGFPRLDQQALQDIRSARFAPYLENGHPVEWETVALLSYELER
ncbi:energy transducer TonB [Roseateles oligotrophus]|uniref:TonB family protein n=1 Tax=Roseateles oligotrophus TaxID=1769250 RepID=A0ABT2YK60_9BURK|nr:energy transducer TonB [Roseateles oligotrophus]MCV2370433.1 TonB family protein [Roseateles oligotrophus]